MIKLQYLQESDFWEDLNNKKPDLVVETVEQIINEIETSSKKRKVKIFEVDINDEYILDFSISKDEYKSVLTNLLNDLISLEKFELCLKIKNFIK